MTCRKCKKQISLDSLFCQYCGAKQAIKVEHKTKSRGNGTGSAYRLPDGKWRAAVTLGYDQNKKRIYKTKSGFKTKKEALEYLPTLAKTIEGKLTMTIREAYQALAPKLGKLSDKRRQCYKSAYRHIKHIEMCDINTLSISDLQNIIDDIEGGFYSKRYVKDLFSKLYAYAFSDGKADRNLAPYIELPKYTRQNEAAIFTKEEIADLWEAWYNDVEFAGYILILIYCALRTGELWSIKVSGIDFDRRVMTGGIKNSKGKYAPIFIVSEIEPVIRHFALKENAKTLFNGNPVAFYRQWREFKKDMKYRDELSPYSGRHTCTTALTEAGLPEAVIMNITRHTKYDTTLQYTHIDVDGAISRMQDAITTLLLPK